MGTDIHTSAFWGHNDWAEAIDAAYADFLGISLQQPTSSHLDL